MKKVITAFVVTLLTNLAFSQSYIKLRSFNTDPNTCNNSAVCEFFNFDYPHYVTPSDWSPTYYFQGDTLHNLCFYDIASAGSGLSGFGSNGYINTLLIGTSLITEDFNYSISAYTQPTAETSQDGSITVVFDSAVTAFTTTIFQDDLYYPPVTVIDPYTIQIDNINLDYLHITLEDPADIYNYCDFIIWPGDPADLYPNTGMDVNVSFQHSGTGCTGWINLQASPPGTYYNEWSDGIANTTTRTNLCPGIYDVYSYNLVGGYYDVGSIDTIVLTNDSLTYIDTNLYNMIPQDTSWYFTDDCFFDYYQPIDSITYSEDTVFYSDPLLIATFEMNIYQGNNMITFSDSLVTLTDSTVLLDVVVYCTLLKTPVFMGQRIMFLRGVENHYFVSPYLDIAESAHAPIALIYPNPVNHALNIDFKTYGDYNIRIIDLQGNQVSAFEIHGDRETFETTQLANGTYVLLIESENSVQQHLFVKAD